jgi:regulator of PEP synthase PpsR (kinase-PPPase family)
VKEGRSIDVFVISDATGRTAHSVIRAILVQFPQIKPRLHTFSNVRTAEKISEILREANAASGIIIYSFVSQELRRYIRNEGKKYDLMLFDLLGPFIAKMHRLFNMIPKSTPGLLAHHESLRLAEAIDFTLKHDDGLGMESIREADLIILGVSRTAKTPSSIYLACNYFLKVANIPIIPDIEPPKSVIEVKTRKVGFTMEPERLAAIRKSRLRLLPELREYTDLKSVFFEIEHSESVFRRLRLKQVINVTDLSVEEIASRIVDNKTFGV